MDDPKIEETETIEIIGYKIEIPSLEEK